MKEKEIISIKVKVDELTKLMSNLQMAVNISQAVLKSLSQSVSKMDADMSNLMGVVNDLQYRTLAMMSNSVFNKEALEVEAERLKLLDFNTASDKEDSINGYTPSDVVTEDSVVIITSSSLDNPDKGIFRSRFKVSETSLKDLKEKLVGSRVGDKFTTTILNDQHEITILGVRAVAPKVEV